MTYMRKPRELQITSEDYGEGHAWCDVGVYAAGPRVTFWGAKLTSLDIEDCRRLAEWLDRAALYLESREVSE